MANLTDLLTDIALGVIDRHNVIVIKNLKSSVSSETLVNWVEVVTEEDVEGDECHYPDPKTSVSLAVLGNSVQDKIDQIQTTVSEKKLVQRVLEVSLIGLPTGLLLLNGQGHAHSVDSLELFFESAKNGGQEDCVQSVDHRDSGVTIILFFPSSLPTAVENIVQKGRQSGHVLNKKTMTVVPYYPSFHDSMINKLGCKEPRRPDTQSQHATHRMETQEISHACSSDNSLDISQFSSVEEDGCPRFPHDNDEDDVKASTIEWEQRELFPKEDDSASSNSTDPFNNEADQDQLLLWENEQKLSETPYNSTETEKKSGKVTFLGVDLPNENRHRYQTEDVSQNKPYDSHKWSEQPNEKHQGQNSVGAMETKTIHFPKHKIILLRISGFGRKKNNLHIELNSEKEEVKLSGTQEDIKKTTDEMLKKLEDIQQHDRKVSHEAAVLLEHKMSIPNFTRQTLIGDKIYAHVTCLAKDNNVRAYALQRDHAKRAVDKMLSLIDSTDIGYSECHFKYLAGPDWQNLVQKWEGPGSTKINVMRAEKKIRITSLTSPADMVRDIQRELEKYSNVTGKPFTVDGGKGKLLHYCLQEKLRQIESTVRSDGGHMEHGYKAGAYIVTVQGNPNIVRKAENQFHSLISSIWEGNVDLNRLEGKSRPPSDDEVKVMIEGLSSDKGREFFKRFSREHSCVVLFTPKSGARHGPRSVEQRPMIRSSSMPVLDQTPPRSHGRHQMTSRVEQGPQNSPHQRRNRDYHGHAHRNSTDITGHRKPERYPRLSKSITVGNCTITAKKGSIIEESANILVNVVGESRNFTESLISRKFREVGGIELEKFFKRSDVGGSTVFTPSAGGLLCENVFHMILRKWRPDQKTTLKRELESALEEMFSEAKNLRATTIAFPAVGPGKLLEYPVPFIADCMISVAVTACKQGTSLRNVNFVIFDTQQLEVFIQHLEKEESAYSYQQPTFAAPVPTPGYSRDEVTSYTPHPRSRSDMSPGCMTLFCTPKEKGRQLQSTLSADLRKNFLTKEKIQLHSSKVDKKGIYQLCNGKCAQVKIEQDKKEMTVFGEKDDVHSVTKKVYRLLHESASDHTPKKYVPPDRSKHGTPHYWQELYENPPTPQYWKHFKSGYSFMDHARMFFNRPSRTEIIQVDPTTFGFVKSLVEKTFNRSLVGKGNDAVGLSHSQLVVRKVERIENYALYEGYAHQRRRLFKHKSKGKSKCMPLEATSQQRQGPIQTSKHIDSHLLSDMFKDINEHYFFHGTDDDRISRIAENGLDPRYGGKNGMFGQGIYAAECSTKADQYADTAQSRQKRGRKMLMMRLLLGDMYVTSQPYKYSLPPCKTCNKEKCLTHKYTYNSVVADGQWLFREFVVYDKNQCYPEYIITYDRQ